MDQKDRYRLYKSGKRWLASLLVTAAIGGGVVMTTPAAQAADGGQTAVTQADQTDTEENIAALKDAVYAGGWQNLTYPDVPLSTYLEKAEQAAPENKEAALQEVWVAVASAVSLDAMLKELNISNAITESNQVILTDYGNQESPLPEYKPDSNAQAWEPLPIEEACRQINPSQSMPKCCNR